MKADKSGRNKIKTVLLVHGSPNTSGIIAKALSLLEKRFTDNDIRTVCFELGNKAVRGRLDCDGCRRSQRCIFSDDNCSELIEKMLKAVLHKLAENMFACLKERN
ncbi:MAG: hypothetical protein IJK53_00755 [Erysipelotrichaceae bacterium]|nr:hypothetical protein [Erysipelotrichaceae bacterium]